MSEIRPQFFLVRENDTIVPLIALDELPVEITINGIPRQLGMADTGGMTSVGKVPSRGVVYVVTGVSKDSGSPEGKNDRFGKGRGRYGDKKHGGQTSQGQKEYCSYWIRHGECMFQQQGCIYKHVMPMDPETMKKVGLNDIPPWYQKKFGVPSLRSSGVNQNNWRKPRGTQKAIEPVDQTARSNGNVTTPDGKKSDINVAAITPESSNDEETVTAARVADASHEIADLTDKMKNTVITAKNGANPVTPPNANHYIDFERVGTASFGYKYDASPQTPTERLPMRSRRLFESKGPNNDYSTSQESTPSMTLTENSFYSFSSLGGTPRSTSEQTVKMVSQDNKFPVTYVGDFNAADDTWNSFNDELDKIDANEPGYRSISELLPTSFPEDRYGNLILI
ncbi:conserved hypothetical protein [Talaromyces stipitatus ATCC 10500]|uniref:C3H1-type domain-containing protein n=1 Tax=Talaromyces stipitatus (strain ATCC 10500 / CBS 375.48 / QM 6759 / NRRL 1006) TaxID=441959 RepID=B8M9F2_TALSN|nr:uncharacterized protein TSTA_115110 [Talaromyces stipitatus ATCC 10500]EED17712.1 conserved hypothetical protein [Talaromyces stipitatus ATCC 10500]